MATQAVSPIVASMGRSGAQSPRPPCRAGSAAHGRTPGTSAAGATARSAVALIKYGSIRQQSVPLTTVLPVCATLRFSGVAITLV